MKNQLAIYDLDRTITLRGTYTSFLLFAAARRSPLRLALLPTYLLALVAYPLGLVSRKALKQIGFRLFIGANIGKVHMDTLASAYVAQTMRGNLAKGVLRQIARDRMAGHRLVLATAAPDYYAHRLGQQLGFDAVIATRQARGDNDSYLETIEGENCYGEEKLARIRAWLEDSAIAREGAEIRFYSDHISDLPVLRWADAAVAVKPDRALALLAARSGWRVLEHA